MIICVDIQSAVTQRAGIGRYARQLAEHLPCMAPDMDFRFSYFDFRGNAKPTGIASDRLNPVRWCPGSLAQLGWKTLHFPPFDWFAGPADVYHFPNFVIPPLSRGAAVVNIHDISFLRYPEFAEEKNLRYLSATIRDTARRASAIITGSKFTAHEIAESLSVDSAKVFAIYNGIGQQFAPQATDRVAAMRSRLVLDKPYLLAVGTVEPRKNLPFLFEVFERLTSFDGELVIAGMPGWKNEPIIERMRQSPRAGSIKWIRYVEDADLPLLYAGAECFVMSSHYEGFGFPPLEAMACGTPVVSSSGGSLTEVLGNAAVVLHHFEADGWVEAIGRMLAHDNVRQRLVEQGRRHAAKFTWQETVRKTLEVYRQVAVSGGRPA